MAAESQDQGASVSLCGSHVPICVGTSILLLGAPHIEGKANRVQLIMKVCGSSGLWEAVCSSFSKVAQEIGAAESVPANSSTGAKARMP